MRRDVIHLQYVEGSSFLKDVNKISLNTEGLNGGLTIFF